MGLWNCATLHESNAILPQGLRDPHAVTPSPKIQKTSKN